jgi:Spy/CpxP family protein refolding chaperone
MNDNGLVKRRAIAAGFLFLCAATGLSSGQSSAPGAAVRPVTTSPALPGNDTSRPDFFAGLALTDDQAAKIDQIHKDTKSRQEAVERDQKMSADAKEAMLVGYRRLEDGKIFEVLTPAQQREVSKRVSAWRTAARQRQSQLQQSQLPEGKSQQK